MNEHNQYDISLFDINNKPIEYQMIKEESNIAFQHRVRLIFKAHVPAFSVTSYRAHIGFKDELHLDKVFPVDDDIIIKDNVKTVVISKKTGFLSSFKVGDKEYLEKVIGKYGITYKKDYISKSRRAILKL